MTHAFTTLKQKLKKAIFIVAGDFNLLDIHLESHTVTDNNYPHCVSETFLDIALDLNLEQVFMSHPSYKVRNKPLPPVGYKRDYDVVLLETAYRPHRARVPRRKLYLWRKADTQGIKQHLQSFSTTSTNSSEHDSSPVD